MSRVNGVVAMLATLALYGTCDASEQKPRAAAVDSHALLSTATDGADWAAYGRTYDETHHSPLTQIDAKNVAHLGLAWSFDLPTMSSSVGAPLAIDGVLYFAVGLSELYAFDAASGRQLWHYDPEVARVAGERLKGAWGIRGVAWWNGKIYVGTQDGRLIAVDAKTGKPVWSVQTLPEGSNHYISGAPRAFNGKVIIGNGGADYGHVRGFVTTYDAETGKQLWRFYTVPGDPSKGFENDAMAMAAKTWTGRWWEWGGGGTVWNAITYDPEFDRVYIGTGNGAPWNRKIRSPGGGDNLFLCAVVALDANTGKYVWHYQTTPGESWDYNSAMDMELATLSINGAERKVLLHAPKNGFFYVLDRRDGKLISAQPFAKVTWAKGIDPATSRPIEDPAARYPNGEAFIWPGPLGAHNWQAMAYSPKTQLAYIPIFNVPGYYDDRGIDPKTWQHPVGMVSNGGLNTVIPDMPPADGKPLGALQAWDPVRQREAWSVPQLGAMNGGVLSTAGDLVFQGQADGRFVARAADSGRELWSFAAQNGIVAQPITYLANGKQYVSVITGYSGTASAFGPSSAQFGWEYRRQQRRVLTFALDGKESLPPAPKIEATKPPDDPSFVVNPTLAESGAKHFANRCAVCHGLAAIAGGAAPDLRYSAIPLSAPAFHSIVHDGALVSRGMPKFEILGDGDLEAIRHYLRRQARAAAKTPSDNAP